VERRYSPEEKGALLSKIKRLTGRQDWKAYNKNGLTLLLILGPGEEDLNTTRQLAIDLNGTGTMRAKQMRTSSNKKYVVKLDKINFNKLMNTQALEGSIEQVAKSEASLSLF